MKFNCSEFSASRLTFNYQNNVPFISSRASIVFMINFNSFKFILLFFFYWKTKWMLIFYTAAKLKLKKTKSNKMQLLIIAQFKNIKIIYKKSIKFKVRIKFNKLSSLKAKNFTFSSRWNDSKNSEKTKIKLCWKEINSITEIKIKLNEFARKSLE